MIRISSLNTYYQQFINLVDNLHSVHVVTNESDIKNIISNLGSRDKVLIVLIPSSDSKSFDSDNITDRNIASLALLRPFIKGTHNEVDVMEFMDDCGDGLEIIKKKMHEDFQETTCGLMGKIDWNSFHTDPEKDIYSTAGYSLSWLFDISFFRE